MRNGHHKSAVRICTLCQILASCAPYLQISTPYTSEGEQWSISLCFANAHKIHIMNWYKMQKNNIHLFPCDFILKGVIENSYWWYQEEYTLLLSMIFYLLTSFDEYAGILKQTNYVLYKPVIVWKSNLHFGKRYKTRKKNEKFVKTWKNLSWAVAWVILIRTAA